MALTRKFLSALGIESEKIDEIIAAHTETVDGLKEERDRYKTSAEKLEAVEKELGKLKDEAAKNDGKNLFETKYKALKEEFEQFKSDTTAKETKAKKESAYRRLLKEAGISEKRIDSVLKVCDIDSIEFDENGKIKDAAELTKSIQSEWSDFIITTTTQGARIATPPANNGSVKMSKNEILAIKDRAERQKAIAENHDLFGF